MGRANWICTLAGFAACLSLGACAGRAARSTVPTQSVEMEAMRIVASPTGEGYEFESYDASDLFGRAEQELEAGRCEQAVALYDRLLREFTDSAYVSPSLYNAGLCLAQAHESARALPYFETLIRTLPDSPDVKHASFQAGHLAVELERWDAAKVYAEALLAREDLPPDERLEATAVRASALVGLDELDAAEREAQQGLQFYRLHGFEEIPDPHFAASLAFSYAETLRLRAEAVELPETSQAAQRAALEERAQWLLKAQRAYWDTIRHTDPHWSAAAGHRIGQLYESLWHAIMAVPVPADLSEGARPYYHQELAKLIKPLLRKAIRNWELTLMMVERTGVDTPWAAETREDLERARALLLEQPLDPAPSEEPPDGPQQAPEERSLDGKAVPPTADADSSAKDRPPEGTDVP